jgi:hypothetical protein
MCWNYQVSLIFSGLYLVTNSYYWFVRPRFWKEYLMFGMFYFIMEVFQTVQWLYGDVHENMLQGVSQCSSLNQKFTIFSHILIWLQPILFSYIGYRTTSNNKNYFFKLTNINLCILIISLVNLYYGLFCDDYYQINNSIFGLSTCTNIGYTGHLVWRFKPDLIDYFPNYLMYLVMCILSFIMYDRPQILIIGIGWAISLAITILYFQPTTLEIASSWCLLSIIANVIIFAYLKINSALFSTR